MSSVVPSLDSEFVIRHRGRFRGNRRMAMILKNVDRMAGDEAEEIQSRASQLRRIHGISVPAAD